jgi:hypothetical protein
VCVKIRQSLCVYAEHVLNVVNPPHIPVVTANCAGVPAPNACVDTSIPKTKLPPTLIAGTVHHSGSRRRAPFARSCNNHVAFARSCNNHLPTAPTPPPTPTAVAFNAVVIDGKVDTQGVV